MATTAAFFEHPILNSPYQYPSRHWELDPSGQPTNKDSRRAPFFLRGSGYAEGTLFPWTASDFSLIDAIECGIVKLPCVPVADNIPGGEMPKFRNLWEHIRPKMPKWAAARRAGSRRRRDAGS